MNQTSRRVFGALLLAMGGIAVAELYLMVAGESRMLPPAGFNHWYGIGTTLVFLALAIALSREAGDRLGSALFGGAAVLNLIDVALHLTRLIPAAPSPHVSLASTFVALDYAENIVFALGLTRIRWVPRWLSWPAVALFVFEPVHAYGLGWALHSRAVPDGTLERLMGVSHVITPLAWAFGALVWIALGLILLSSPRHSEQAYRADCQESAVS